MKTVLVNFIKGILAGVAIGIGGLLYVLMTAAFSGDLLELGKILGSILFAVGLFLVCTFYLSLYTGKIGLIYEKKQDKLFYISLPIMLIGNLGGALFFGFVSYLIFKDTSVYNAALNAANSRLALNAPLDYVSTCIKSFLCGVCVYLAVKAFNLNRLKPLGIILLVFFVFLFVYCGFQHCIANMFYFGMANTYCIELIINLVLVIIFNSLGPIVPVYLIKLIEKNK